MGNKRTRKYPKKPINVNQPQYGGDKNDDQDKVEVEMADINRTITSTVRAVSSRRELHSLVLMVFLFTVDQYIEQEDTFYDLMEEYYEKNSQYVPDVEKNINALISSHYTKSKNYYEDILYKGKQRDRFKFIDDKNLPKGLNIDKIVNLLSPVLYKKEILTFAHKIAYIIGQYHKLLNIVFYSDRTYSKNGHYTKTNWGIFRDKDVSKELPVIPHSLTLLDSEILDGINKIMKLNILTRYKTLSIPPDQITETKSKENFPNAADDATADDATADDATADDATADDDIATDGNSNTVTTGNNVANDSDNLNQKPANIKSGYIFELIKTKMSEMRNIKINKMNTNSNTNEGETGNKDNKIVNCIDLYTFYTDPDNHPYFPRPLNTDWIYADVDELIRYASVYTHLLEIVMSKYDTIIKHEEQIGKNSKYSPIVASKNKREEYMMRRGSIHIGDSKMHTKFASVRRGVGTIGKTLGIIKDKPTAGTRRRRNRKVMKLSKRIKRNPKKFRRVNKTAKRKGGSLLSKFTALRNKQTYIDATKKIGKVIDTQTGLTKVTNRVLNSVWSQPNHEQIYFNIDHSSKYEFLLYLDSMFDLFKVNGFDAGDVLEGQELGLSPRVKEFLENVKAEELKEIDDEMEILKQTKKFYISTVNRSTRIMNKFGEVKTQAYKVASAMMRAKNGQWRIYEEGAKMMRNTFKSLRTLVGFMNKNGVIGYAIGTLHLIANLGPFLSVAFPPAAGISIAAALLRTGLVIVASPILQLPTVILRKKEDIMRVAESMMRLDFNEKNDRDGSVKDENNFLKKIIEYYDTTRFIKTDPTFSYTVVLQNDTDTSKINRPKKDNTIFENAIKKVETELSYMNIYNNSNEITSEEKWQISRYYLAQYSADNNMSMYNGCFQILDIGNQESPFRRYIEYLKVRNKEYVLNEIYKLQLLLKGFFLKTITPNHQVITNYKPLNIINNNTGMTKILNSMINFYDTLYDQSRTPRSYILGSPENLEQNFKELDPNVRKIISTFCEINANDLNDRDVFNFGGIPTRFNDQIIQFVELQMGKTMKTRNETSAKLYDKSWKDNDTNTNNIIIYKSSINNNNNKYDKFITDSTNKPIIYPLYTYDKTCDDSMTGMHMSGRTVRKIVGKKISTELVKNVNGDTNVSLEYADICNIQDKFKTRIRQYMVAAAYYAKSYKEPTIVIPEDIYNKSKLVILKLFVYMQHFAKRAYIELDGTTINGILNAKFNGFDKNAVKSITQHVLNGGDKYIEWYINQLNTTYIDNKYISIPIQSELINYMRARYVKDKYKLKLTLADKNANTTEKNVGERLDQKLTDTIKDNDVSNPSIKQLQTDYDIAGEIEKQVLNEKDFKFKTMDVNYSITETVNPMKNTKVND